ncbi:hypothetical protein A2U01_0101611, partial [Trifolium medium]|nr:hypothetical protein [Trifolium medium]
MLMMSPGDMLSRQARLALLVLPDLA